LDNKGNEITISSNIPEIGNVEEKMIVSKDNDQDIRIAFSSKYMLDALKAFDCEDVELLFNGEVSPIIVKNPNTDNLIQLILPIRTY
jgi:DNA polymerase-3 subunit beta